MIHIGKIAFPPGHFKRVRNGSRPDNVQYPLIKGCHLIILDFGIIIEIRETLQGHDQVRIFGADGLFTTGNGLLVALLSQILFSLPTINLGHLHLAFGQTGVGGTKGTRQFQCFAGQLFGFG